MPLVSVGIPTYNRPEGLKVALRSALSQSYANIEVVISDNASTDPAVMELLDQVRGSDHRLRVFRQSENIGAARNFAFVAEQASGSFFIWLADDDEWPARHLETMVACFRPGVVAVFPDVTECGPGGGRRTRCLSRWFRNCRSDSDYLMAWCRSGVGYPVYGLFDVSSLRQMDMSLAFSASLAYFNEGMLLHKLFLHGGMRFCRDTSLMYSLGSAKPDAVNLLSMYVEYTREVLLFYLGWTSWPSERVRQSVMRALLDQHTTYLRQLCGVPLGGGVKSGIRRWLADVAKVCGLQGTIKSVQSWIGINAG